MGEFVIELPKKKTQVWDNYVPILKNKKGKKLHIYLTEQIGVPSEYNESCYELMSMPEDGEVTITINTPGGCAASAFAFVDAMRKCPAKIHGIITGSVASAGTIITMACDTIEVADHSDFMIHNYSHGTAGSGAQVKEYVNFADREFSKAVKEIYAGFITPEEMVNVSEQDKEIWLNKEEVLERWNNKINS